MAQLEMDRFEAWIRDRSRACMMDYEIDDLMSGSFDIDGSGGFIFEDSAVQAQWEAWQAALVDRPTLRPMSTAPNDGTPILVRLEKKSLNTFWHVAQIHPNVTFIGHYFAHDCSRMIGWLPLPVIPETEVPDATR